MLPRDQSDQYITAIPGNIDTAASCHLSKHSIAIPIETFLSPVTKLWAREMWMQGKGDSAACAIVNQL